MEQARVVLRACPLLCRLPREKLALALRCFVLRSYPTGARVAAAQATSEGLFVLVQGTAVACPADTKPWEDSAQGQSPPESRDLEGQSTRSDPSPASEESRALEYSLDDDLGSAVSVAEMGGPDPRAAQPPSQFGSNSGALSWDPQRGVPVPPPYTLREGDWFGHPPSGSPAPLSPSDVFATSPLVCAFFPQSTGCKQGKTTSSALPLPMSSAVPHPMPSVCRLVSSPEELDALLAEKLEEIMQLQTLADRPDSFRGTTPREMFSFARIFGGQLLGQALMAATRTVDSPLLVHSLHAYFLRPGNTGQPVEYRVERIRDGSSFSARRVKGFQGEREIFLLTASFQKPEPGLSFSVPPALGVPGPEDLLMVEEEEWRMRTSAALPMVMRRRLSRAPVRPMPVELRHCESVERLAISQLLRDYSHPALQSRATDGGMEATGHGSRLNAWIKARGVSSSSSDLRLHRCIIAFFSDFVLLGTVLAPHGLFLANPRRINVASLDHAMWFHEECRADKWLLYSLSSPWTGHARGLALGRMFTQEGALVVSTAQEGLVRLQGTGRDSASQSRL